MSDIVLRLRCLDTLSLVTFNVKSIDNDVVSFLDNYTTVKICLKPLEPIFIMRSLDSFDIWCLCNDTEKEEAISKMSILLKQEFNKLYSKYYKLQCDALKLLKQDNIEENSNGVVVTCNDLITILDASPNIPIRLQLGSDSFISINSYKLKSGSLHLTNVGFGEELNTSTLVESLLSDIGYVDFKTCLGFDVFYGESARFKAEIKNNILVLELV